MELALTSTLDLLLSSDNLVTHPILTALSESTPAFIIKVFDIYFIAMNFLGQLLLGYFMVQFLDFDLLFTGLISLFWLVIPSFNIVYLLSSDTFKKTFASS